MLAGPQTGVQEVAALAESRALHSFAAVVAVMAVVSLVFWRTGASMVAIWSRSETFAHGFLVVPAVVWLCWKARTRLAATGTRPAWSGLMALSFAGAAWLMAELGTASAPAQLAMVLMVPSALLTLFGWGWLRVLAFPLAFLCFAVPFGEVLVPTLIDWTAEFTVAAVKASGIPVFREGADFVIPSGRWSVVEACSGIRYLIASLVVGALYAWTMYRSPLRRAVFISCAVVVPLVANWLRAYMIVMIGHLTDNRFAAGVDHLVYGWLFFGVVLAPMFLIGARWREDVRERAHAGLPASQTTVDFRALKARLLPPASSLIAAALLIGAWPVARDFFLAAGDMRPVQPATVAPDAGWIATPAAVSSWRPKLESPASVQTLNFSRGDSAVTALIGYYRDQRGGSELVNSMNRLVPGDGGQWKEISQGHAAASLGSGASRVRTATLRDGGQQLRVWNWYWIDGHVTTSDARAKLSLALDRLFGRSDTSAWVVIWTTAEDEAVADLTLAAFTRDLGPAIQSALAATAAR